MGLGIQIENNFLGGGGGGGGVGGGGAGVSAISLL